MVKERDGKGLISDPIDLMVGFLSIVVIPFKQYGEFYKTSVITLEIMETNDELIIYKRAI